MGRKKVPTKIKELQGTLAKTRTLANEMQVTSVKEVPAPPSYLSKDGKLEWKIVCTELFNKGMLHLVDMSLLSAYCNEMGSYLEYSAYINEHGAVERTYRNGKVFGSKLRPEARIARDSLAAALKIATQFGFTPASRASIPQPEIKEEEDEFKFF